MKMPLELPALVPLDSKGFFQKEGIPGMIPSFYDAAPESLLDRFAGKLFPRDNRQLMAARLGVKDFSVLPGDAYALWLSPSLYLPPALMASLLDKFPGLRWVYSQVTGTEHLDLVMFRERGIMVSNAGRLHSRRVAEMALACIIGHAKRLPAHLSMQRMRRWRSLQCEDLCRQTVGIIGTGNIGAELASLCSGIGIRTVGASRDPSRFGPDPFPYHRIVSLHEDLDSLLSETEHVVVALPLQPETKGLIGRNEILRMNPGSSLIIVSRGAIVDENELCKALSDGRVGAAYIDRPGGRLPPYPWSRLYRTRNLILTHYSAANSPNRSREAFEQFRSGFLQLVETGHPPNRVA